jgi:hypothetical protein
MDKLIRVTAANISLSRAAENQVSVTATIVMTWIAAL